MMPALGLVGTVVGFGGFGYAVVKLTKKDWKAVAVGTAVGAASLALVGWNLRTLRDVVPFGAEDYMNRDDVEKVLDASKGKIVSVTFIKRTNGEKRTLVGRIGKNYKPKGADPLGGKKARRGRDLFTIYDMQKGGFRMISMDSVISIRAAGKDYKAAEMDYVKEGKHGTNSFATAIDIAISTMDSIRDKNNDSNPDTWSRRDYARYLKALKAMQESCDELSADWSIPTDL